MPQNQDTQPAPLPKGRRRRLKRIAILPTLLTLGNMLCGFAAVYFCVLGIFDAAAHVDPAVKTTLNIGYMEKFLPTFVSVGGFLVFVGMFFDMMDGRIARMTTGTTNFGGQLDSLSDMVSFGVAPAMLMITVVTMHARLVEDVIVTTKEAWMAGAIYAACCALRLARYNVEHAETGQAHSTFSGMPSPGAAALVASMVILHEYLAESRHVTWLQLGLLNVLPGIALVAGLLMVSRIRYRHVANTYLRGRRPFGYVVIILIVLGCLIRLPAPTMAVLASAYALSAPVRSAWRSVFSSGHSPGRSSSRGSDTARRTSDGESNTAIDDHASLRIHTPQSHPRRQSAGESD